MEKLGNYENMVNMKFCTELIKVLCFYLLISLTGNSDLPAQPTKDIGISGGGGKRIAAVVGVAAYRHAAPLPNTLSDADSMVLALQALGFEVMTLRDPSLADLERFAEDFYRRMQRGRYEAALFYFSGHGMSVFDHNYLVPVDARPLSERDVQFHCLNASRILSLMEEQVPVKILVLDACRDNPYEKSWALKSGSSNGLSFMRSPEGTFIGFAASPGAKASAGRYGSNSLYTAALLQHLPSPGLTIDQVFTRAAATTRQLAERENYTQVPFKNSSLTADFYFLPGATPAPPVEPTHREDPPVPTRHPDPIQQLIDNMVHVQGGTFTMGCTSEQGSNCSYDELPTHRVTLSDFHIGRYEVTQAQWRAVMGSDPPELYNKVCDQCPVERVSWVDVQEFIGILNTLTGLRFRLPTEAEWEYAARGGNRSRGYKYSGGNDIDDVGWYEDNAQSGNMHGAQKTTRPIGLKKPNELGLYDMSGNVWEWCNDRYWDYTGLAQTDPTGPSSGSSRVHRGGSWDSSAQGCRVSIRNYYPPAFSDFFLSLGFRLARS